MQLKLYPVLALVGLCVSTSARNFQEDFYTGFNILTREGKETVELKNALAEVKFPHLFRENYTQKQKKDIGTFVCMFCDVALDILITASNDGTDIGLISNAVTYLCANLVIESEVVCKGAIDLHMDTLYYIMTAEKSKATSERMCSMLLQDFNCIDNSTQPWSIPIPPPLSENQTNVFVKQEVATPIKIVQLTDFHYDPKYEVGSNGDCLEPLCCQAGSKPASPEGAAGYWGDYRNCDLPWHNVIDTLNQIVLTHRKIDYVYFTGDIINHKVWQTDVPGNTEAMIKVYKQFKKSFGYVPVFPILGNHEPHPVNQFSYDYDNNEKFGTEWLYKLASEQWSPWLPKDTQETILKGGYYTVKVKEGLRIIALNSNVCYTFNFWLFYDDVDPFGQLQWLCDTLEEAEKQKEKVHIISHIPTGGSSCLHNWSTEFTKIINRFSHIISAQFNGHTHNDETVIFYEGNTEKAINIAFNGGSLTTYPDLNPNYKVYDVDPVTFNVLNFESWTYNLTEANWDPQTSPKWHKLYDFKDQYKLNDLTPTSVSKLVEQMALDITSNFLQTYFRNKNREADTALAIGCNSDCEMDNLCNMVTSHKNNFHCKQITDKYNSARPDLQNNDAK